MKVRFSAPIETGPWAHPAYYTMGTESSPRVKWPGCGVDHPPTSSAKVKNRVELYLYSLFEPLWPFLGWTLPLPYQIYVDMKAIAPTCLCTSVPSLGKMGAISVTSMYIWYCAFGCCNKLKTMIYVVKFFKNDINRLMSCSQTVMYRLHSGNVCYC